MPVMRLYKKWCSVIGLIAQQRLLGPVSTLSLTTLTLPPMYGLSVCDLLYFIGYSYCFFNKYASKFMYMKHQNEKLNLKCWGSYSLGAIENADWK